MTRQRPPSLEPIQIGESVMAPAATVAELKANAGPRPTLKPAQAYFTNRPS
jgi:hypothetical protein